MEYSIGDFSRICRLGIKTLRYYHEIGLLEPTRIDRLNGYRYYNETLLERVRRILKLKKLDFSLDEIKELLENAPDDVELVKRIERKIVGLDDKIAEYQRIRERLMGFVLSEQNRVIPLSSSSVITEVTLPGQYFASQRFQGRYDDITEWLEKLFQACGSRVNGRPFSLYYDNSSMEQDADIEICLPVEAYSTIAAFSCRHLPGGRALSIVHTGSYENLSLSYQVLVNTLYQRGLPVILPVREVYLKGPGLIAPRDSRQYQTEIQFMLP